MLWSGINFDAKGLHLMLTPFADNLGIAQVRKPCRLDENVQQHKYKLCFS